jgi:hypothetical protein
LRAGGGTTPVLRGIGDLVSAADELRGEMSERGTPGT